MTKVVVLEKIKKNWDIGSVVSVKDGYARNYLIPNGKAKFATKQNVDEIKSLEKSLIKKDDEYKSNANVIASKINELKFTKEIAAKENGELYGSIKPKEITNLIKEKTKAEVSPSQIILKNELNKIRKAINLGKNLGLEVHAGHGLTYKSAKILSNLKNIKEFNIGHFLVGESIFIGLTSSIKKFKKIFQ